VTVHGTAFSVTVHHDDAQLTHTCVDLREGVISVTAAGHTERLTAPARWGCDNNVTATPPNDAKAAAITTEPTPSISPAPASEPTKPRHTLALETRLLQTALGAEQRRDFTTAEKNLRALLSSYPNSVVAPEARAALERVATKNAKQK
jgi:TolA-binding protein